MITLVLPIVCTQLIYSGGNFTGSSSGLSGFESFDLSIEAWFWLSGGFLVAVTSVIWLLVHSDAGRILVAIRENEQRCKYLGLDTARLKIPSSCFAASSARSRAISSPPIPWSSRPSLPVSSSAPNW